MAVDIEAFIRDADAALSKLDEDTVLRVRRLLQQAFTRHETELRKRWSKALEETADKDRSFREARGRVINDQLRELLNVIDNPKLPFVIDNHVKQAVKLEELSSDSMVKAFDPKDATNFRIPIEKITNISSNIVARLSRHSQDFIAKAEEVIVNGLVNGHGFRRTAIALKKQADVTYARAEMVVRTETMNASDEVRKGRYKASNIEYVQRIATQDKRVCGFCAARAGNVYKIDDAPQALHPNDRCYNAPWKKEWQELGLVDTDWIKKHADDARKRSEDSLHYGPAPFEKYAGMDKAPKPVWSPYNGYIK